MVPGRLFAGSLPSYPLAARDDKEEADPRRFRADRPILEIPHMSRHAFRSRIERYPNGKTQEVAIPKNGGLTL